MKRLISFLYSIFAFLISLTLLYSIGTAPAHATPVRVMTANLTSGSGQSYQKEGIRILQGLKPDVVLIQEWNYRENTDTDIQSLVDQICDSGCDYFRESNAQIPNGVVSHWPIIDEGEWSDPNGSNRDFAWARIDVPGTKDLWAVSVHLRTSSSLRDDQARDLVDEVLNKVPTGDYLVIGGDFNTANHGEDTLQVLSQVVITSPPFPTDQRGNSNTNASRRKPLDGLYVDTDLAAQERPVVLGSNQFPNGLVFDSRRYSPLSDARPVLASDSGASQMQHMAVVRDFDLL